MNVVALTGALSRPPEARVLPSGDRLLSMELSVARRRPGERAETVPVVWPDAPARAGELGVGEEVVVTGRVRRRFFRAGGATQSRTEVVADSVVPTRQARRVEAALEAAAAKVAALASGAPGEPAPEGPPAPGHPGSRSRRTGETRAPTTATARGRSPQPPRRRR
ncbi:MAG: single-stranded DNA-binding protein [Acidimicrobiales bacterium]